MEQSCPASGRVVTYLSFLLNQACVSAVLVHVIIDRHGDQERSIRLRVIRDTCT